jgi:hypothetical protein
LNTLAYWFSIDGEVVETDHKIQTVNELRQEIAAKSDLGQHIFSRLLIWKGEPLHNLRKSLSVHEQAFLTRRA